MSGMGDWCDAPGCSLSYLMARSRAELRFTRKMDGETVTAILPMMAAQRKASVRLPRFRRYQKVSCEARTATGNLHPRRWRGLFVSRWWGGGAQLTGALPRTDRRLRSVQPVS